MLTTLALSFSLIQLPGATGDRLSSIPTHPSLGEKGYLGLVASIEEPESCAVFLYRFDGDRAEQQASLACHPDDAFYNLIPDSQGAPTLVALHGQGLARVHPARERP